MTIITKTVMVMRIELMTVMICDNFFCTFPDETGGKGVSQPQPGGGDGGFLGEGSGSSLKADSDQGQTEL